MNPDKYQIEAIKNSLNDERLTIINGGAGTGKTSLIKEIVIEFERIGKKYKQVCFTGKAAARLRKKTNRKTNTIHSLLKYNGERFMEKSLTNLTIIIDEASMIDVELLSEIVKRRPAKIILIGDEAQLPPVGRGQPFHDLIKLKPNTVSNLKRFYRNKNAVLTAANLIRNKKLPEDEYSHENEIFKIAETGTPEKTQKMILNWIKKGALNFETDVILVCRNGDAETPGTVRGLNQSIKKIVNPSREKWDVNDRIICLKNFPNAEIWNGSTGTITGIDENIYVVLDGSKKEIQIDKKIQKYCQHAYALTVHKSQGSQYRNVIFACFSNDFFMLDNALIYTAVTRAKKKCIITGNKNAFKLGINKKLKKETNLGRLK